MKKLTKEQQLYIDKQLEFTEELYNKADEQLKEVYKAQLSNRNEILTEIANTMLSYNIADSKLSISIAEKKKLKEKLSKVIKDKIQDELINETKLADELLKTTGKEKYNINNYIHDIGMNTSWDIKPVDDETLKEVINTKVDNKVWSDRLWDNKNTLQKDLQLEVNNFLNGKTSVNEIESKIKKKYNSNAYNTKRLVQDNVARVQEGMNDVWREEHNIKRVLYMATLCHNTCGNCGQYDGKDYPLDKKPILLPQHPFCRCTYVNIPHEGWRPKMRMDNESKEKINWQSYEEWYLKNTAEARADKYITNVTDGEKIDTIQPRNIFKELNKSSIGKETIEYIENNNLNLEFKYFNVLDGVRGIHWGKNQIEIFIPNTKTKVLTAQTLIHEITHVKYNIRDTQWAETVCFLKEQEHIKGTLTVKDKRDTIKLVKKLYPELPWR